MCSPAISYVQAEPAVIYNYAKNRLKSFDLKKVERLRERLVDAFVHNINTGEHEYKVEPGGTGTEMCLKIKLSRDRDEYNKQYYTDLFGSLVKLLVYLQVQVCGWTYDRSNGNDPGDYCKALGEASYHTAEMIMLEAFRGLLLRMTPEQRAELASAYAQRLSNSYENKAFEPSLRPFLQRMFLDPSQELEHVSRVREGYAGVTTRMSYRENVGFSFQGVYDEMIYDFYMALMCTIDQAYRKKFVILPDPAQLWEHYAAGDAQLFTAQLGQLLAHKADAGFLNSVLRKIALSPAQWSVDPNLAQILTYLDDWFFKHSELTYKACLDHKVDGLTILDEVVDQFKAGAFDRTGFRDRISWLQRKGAEMTDHVRAVAAADATVKKILNVYGYR